LNLIVADADASAARAVAAGATEVFPVADQPYGLRQGRVADPYGHHWLIGTPLTGLRKRRNTRNRTARAVAMTTLVSRTAGSTQAPCLTQAHDASLSW
jgi:hypothetical protein